MKKILCLLLAAVLLLSLCACGKTAAQETEAQTLEFTDSSDRTVTVPKTITKVAPSGSVAQMILATLAPELLVGLANTPSDDQLQYLPQSFKTLPAFGQFYGSKASLNLEALLAAGAEIIIDLGDRKDSIAADMAGVQEKTGIPTIFIEADLTHLAQAYRTLGTLLGREEKAEQLAAYVDNTLETARVNSEKLAPEDMATVLYATGTDGLNANAEGSTQAQVLGLVGAKNAAVSDEVTNKGTGTPFSLEQLYVFDPDNIIVTADGGYDAITTSDSWQDMRAVTEGRVFEIPGTPYGWMSNPPSMNMVLGIWWLGNILYPQLYDYDMVDKAMEFYQLFYDTALTREEAEAMLARSTGKLQ